MKNRIVTLFVLAFLIQKANAQIGINATNATPNASAMLDVSSTTKGILIPRMTTLQKDAIPNKPEGLTVYDTDLKQFSYWTDSGAGFIWKNFGNTTSSGTGVGWQENGNHLENTNTGNVGIGVLNPTAKLALSGTAPNGTLAVSGSTNTSHFNYPISGLENTYIRGGNNGSNVLINDSQGLGNVGIGTGSPFYKLDVNGDVSILGPGISVGSGGYLTNGGGLTLRNTNNSSYLKMEGAGFQAQKSPPLTSGSLASELYLNPHGGNVGIGTNFTPEYKLHLWANNDKLLKIDGTNPLILFNDRISNAQYGFLRTWTSNPFNPAGLYGQELGVPPSLGTDPAKHLMFSTNFVLRMVIRDNGNIGIGTTDPGAYKLAVNGSIRAKEIRVNTGWADYVFEPNYHLKPLAEVEQFINKNGHLPEIPAAKVIEAEGLDVGVLQTKMMAKIEELTLYMIEANKQIELLKNQILIKK